MNYTKWILFLIFTAMFTYFFTNLQPKVEQAKHGMAHQAAKVNPGTLEILDESERQWWKN